MISCREPASDGVIAIWVFWCASGTGKFGTARLHVDLTAGGTQAVSFRNRISEN